MGKRNTSSFLAANDAAGAAQERAAKALRSSWARMRMAVYYADADESRDANETSDYTLEFSHRFESEPADCFACSNLSSDCDRCERAAEREEDADIPLLDHDYEAADDENLYYDAQEFYRDFARNWFEPEGLFASVNEAKMYARLGAPAVRGRMRYSAILRLSMKFS